MEITRLLQRLKGRDGPAMDDLMPLVYDELKKLARAHVRREADAPLLYSTTTLVHEAFLKFAGGSHPLYENRAHFYGIASRLMRQILVDTARARHRIKRGFGLQAPLTSAPDPADSPSRSVLALHDALSALEAADPLKARVVEMRFFGGMTAEESSAALSLPLHVVRRELRLARAWLRAQLAGHVEVCP